MRAAFSVEVHVRQAALCILLFEACACADSSLRSTFAHLQGGDLQLALSRRGSSEEVALLAAGAMPASCHCVVAGCGLAPALRQPGVLPGPPHLLCHQLCACVPVVGVQPLASSQLSAGCS